MRSNSGDTCCAAALQHQGIVLQPSFMVSTHLRSGALVEVLPAYRSMELGVYAACASRKRLTPKVRVMVDFLAQALRIPAWQTWAGMRAQTGYCWTDGSSVIHFSSVNSSITARPSKRP
jgi:hypothetical protein